MIPSRRPATSLALAALLAGSALAAAGPAAAHRLPGAYDLPADGIRLEGIGVDQRAGVLYVSATNQSGAIYRGALGSDQLTAWVAPAPGNDGRGITVDRRGRVYVAGGPSAELRIFAPDGTLVAELPAAAGAFLNDVALGPDGAVYVTDSRLPIIWRATEGPGGWRLEAWLDVSPTITYTPSTTDFDLGGIVATPGGRYLVVAQGNVGALWRIDLATRAIHPVAVPTPLVNTDGLVLRGDTLYVVQNFTRQISTLALDDHWMTATAVAVTPTPATRTFTTAKLAGGSLLAVDSTFGFAAAPADDRVVVFDLPLR
jgi:Cu-Zn family superoxide dismutase